MSDVTGNLDYLSHWPRNGRHALLTGRRAGPESATLYVTSARRRLWRLSGSRPRPTVSGQTEAKQAGAALDPHKKGWTLHQLRHSALQHLAAGGRTAPELQAKSRHQHLASLGRYVRLGEQTSARVTSEADPAARRRTH